MKKIICFNAAILLSTGVIAFAEPTAIDGLNYELNAENKTATVVAGTYSGDITIPESIMVNDEEYSVTRIGRQAFNRSEITSAIIPNSVDTIEVDAFLNCAQLASINMGSNVNFVGSNAFGLCSNLTNVNITSIADWCKIDFENEGANPINNSRDLILDGERIVNLVIPDDVEKIGSYAFNNSKFETIEIGSGVTEIGRNAF